MKAGDQVGWAPATEHGEEDATMQLSDIGVSYQVVTVDSCRYVVTTGTGETSFGPDGDAAFAYDADDVAALGPEVRSYQDFCDAIEPLDDRALAIVLATKGLRIVSAGACTPVLSDEEWALIQAALAAVQS